VSINALVQVRRSEAKRGFCPSCGARRMAESARHLVEDVFGARPGRQWVLSFPYPLRFLFAGKPHSIGPVLAIAQRVIGACLADEAGVPRRAAQCGAVTLIQRFGSALNLNVHVHMLWLDGVYENVEQPQRKPRLHRTRAPTSAQLTQLASTIAHRVCRHLARRGWLEGEDESVFLSDSAGSDDGMDGLRMSSITYRVATGKHAGRKVVTLQTLPGDKGSLEGGAGQVGGFSLHAGVVAEAHEFHGVFAPNAALRAQLTPSGRGKRPATDAAPVEVSANDEPRSPEEKRRAMNWAQRLKRVFSIDVTPLRPLRRRGADRRQHRGTRSHPRHPGPLREARCAGRRALQACSARTAGGSRVMNCRLRRRRRIRDPTRCGTDPAGLRSAHC